MSLHVIAHLFVFIILHFSLVWNCCTAIALWKTNFFASIFAKLPTVQQTSLSFSGGGTAELKGEKLRWAKDHPVCAEPSWSPPCAARGLARLGAAAECRGLSWCDFIKLTARVRWCDALPSDTACANPARCWDKSGFKPCLSIYLIHLVYFCQLAWKALLSKTISSYFSFQKLLSVHMTCKSYFYHFWLERIPDSYFMAGIWAHSLALLMALRAVHHAQEGHVSCSKYPLFSHVVLNTLWEVAGWQCVVHRNGQELFVRSIISGQPVERSWQWAVLCWGCEPADAVCHLLKKHLMRSQGCCCCAVVGSLRKIFFFCVFSFPLQM